MGWSTRTFTSQRCEAPYCEGWEKNLIHILPITITMCKWVGVFIHTATGYVRPDSLGTRVMGTLAHQYTYPLFDIGEVSIFFSDEPILNS